MSRRRRRSSRGRKSSSSSKQSVSPFIFQKTSKSNSVCCKDDLIEKGETDSLRKENILLVSDEEDKYNDIPSTEKKFRQDKAGDCFLNKKFTKSEDKNQRTKIVTSVTFDNSVQLPSNITFKQSRGSASEGTTDCTMAITTTKLKCTGPNVKFEIQEVLQPNNSGVKTTFVLQCQQEEDTETCLQNQCVSRPTLNDELLEQSQIADLTLEKDTHTTFNYKFTLGKNGKEEHEPLRNTIPSRSCSRSACRKSCCDNDTDFTFVDGSSCPFWPHWKNNTMRNSFSSDVLWDIPPPLEFADSKYDTVGDLTEEMASFRIGASSSSGQRCFSPTLSNKYNQDSFCLDDKESANYLHFFDQISESDNYEPMFMRPSSVSRSSFTKDFIHSHEGKTWMRNNSIAIVERKPCSSASYQKPTKRRRTFPGVSDGLGPMQEDLPSYRESFSSDTISSFVTHSIPCETERLGQFYKEDYRLSPFGIERRPSSLSSCSYRLGSSNANIHQQRQEPSDLFCFTKQEPNEVVLRDGKFPEHKHLPTGNQRQSDVDLSSNWYESMANQVHNNAGDQVEQNEVAESGYDEEMQEVEEQTQEPLAEECGQVDGDLLIQVIPPSRTTSEEHILEGSPTRSPSIALEGNAKVILTQGTSDLLPKRRRGSVMTLIIGGSDHWSLPTESKPTEGSSHEKHHKETYNTVSEVPSVSPILDLEEVESPSTSEIIEEVRATHSRSPSPGNSISSPALIHTEETKPQSPRTAQGLTDQETENLKKTTTHQAVKKLNKSSVEVKEHLMPPVDPVHKDPDSGPDHWAKRRKLFKESRQWSSAGGSSVTSDITEESVSEENHSMDMNVRDVEDKGFYTETYHSASWIYIGDEPIPNTPTTPSLPTRPRPVTIRERTVRIAKGMGEYPWGFRIQFSKPIVVTEVDTNGAAEEAGLQVGDYVMAVNGTDVTSVPHSEAADLARHGPDLLTLTIGSDIGRSPNTPRPACRGYLHKRTQSGLIKGWRKRWFVLRHDCCLYYYRHKKDEGRRRALSAIKLEGAEVAADTSLGKPFVFKCCPLSANRVYFFCATSSQEIKRWLEAMGRAVHPVTQHHVWVDVTRHNASLPPLAVKNPECLGLLHQIDRNKDVCVQHYCILKDGCLYFYHGIRSTHALGGIYLHGYTVREQPMGSKKSTIELKPPSEEFKTFYLCAEDPTENKRWVVAIKASIKKWLPLHQAIQDYINRPPEETRM